MLLESINHTQSQNVTGTSRHGEYKHHVLKFHELTCIGDSDHASPPVKLETEAGTAVDSAHGSQPVEVIQWAEGDPENPRNWPSWRKKLIVVTNMVLVLNSTMGSSLPSQAIPFITSDWGINGQNEQILPISIYLVGYVFGPLIWGPMSEHFGRRWLLMGTFACYCASVLACALAPNWSFLLGFRFAAGTFASSPLSVTTGIFADVYGEPVKRGRAMAFFNATTVLGPIFAPIISGWTAPTIGWRWCFWIGFIYAVLSMILLCFLPETFGPRLLSVKAARMRKQDPSLNVIAASERDPLTLTRFMTVILTRPIRMLVSESIVVCCSAYMSLVYAIFYMSFRAYPIIFQNFYGLSPGVTGLCFLPIGLGAFLTLFVFYWYDSYLRRAQARHAPWSLREEARRLPLACVGGPVFVVSLLWLGWTSRHDVPFVAPMLAGLLFGFGFQAIMMALLNYLSDAYEIYAASAHAVASMCRSLMAVVLPFATVPLFERLGIAGACSLLAGLSAVMCMIPFWFIWKGDQIRAGSKYCIALKQKSDAII